MNASARGLRCSSGGSWPLPLTCTSLDRRGAQHHHPFERGVLSRRDGAVGATRSRTARLVRSIRRPRAQRWFLCGAQFARRGHGLCGCRNHPGALRRHRDRTALHSDPGVARKKQNTPTAAPSLAGARARVRPAVSRRAELCDLTELSLHLASAARLTCTDFRAIRAAFRAIRTSFRVPRNGFRDICIDRRAPRTAFLLTLHPLPGRLHRISGRPHRRFSTLASTSTSTKHAAASLALAAASPCSRSGSIRHPAAPLRLALVSL
jgi:hypothetical protein